VWKGGVGVQLSDQGGLDLTDKPKNKSAITVLITWRFENYAKHLALFNIFPD
jgi:hypothetical protein